MINSQIFVLMATTLMALSIACSNSVSQPRHIQSETNSSPIPSESTPSPSPTPDSPIRRVDFANMTYQAHPVYPEGEEPFKLTDGKYEGRTPEGAIVSYNVWMSSIVYSDVTGDRQEEAMVFLTERVQGMAIPLYIYIYTLELGGPKLLWAFAPGDRGDGGLKRIYEESGDLVIELYGKNTFVDGNLADQEEGTPACCSHFYTRARYQWTGNHFERIRTDILPNPDGDTQVERW